MRYVKTDIPEFEELGLIPVLKTIAEAPRGIVLVSGTTGSENRQPWLPCSSTSINPAGSTSLPSKIPSNLFFLMTNRSSSSVKNRIGFQKFRCGPQACPQAGSRRHHDW